MTDNSEDSEQQPEIALVMPFVTVASKGGPHDDQSYVAGYEMAQLSAFLEHVKPPVHENTILADNVPQADLIAMRHGYTAEFAESGVEGWSFAAFTRTSTEDEK